MKLSYIVSTRNRGDSIVPTLDSIAAQANAELVVVNNGSTDNTAEVLSEWVVQTGFPTTVVFEAKPGLARARNVGMRKASGDIIVFTDDDCRVAVDHGLSIIAAHQCGVAMIIGGKVELGDPSDAPVTIMLQDTPSELTNINDVCGFLHGCNMTLSRSAVDKIGDFDVRFGAGAPFVSAEDTDYLYRAAKLGILVRYDPGIVVSHFHGRKHADEVKRLKHGYAFGKGAMVVKHRDLAFIKMTFWYAKAALLDKLKGVKYDKDPYHVPLSADLLAIAEGAIKALRTSS